MTDLINMPTQEGPEPKSDDCCCGPRDHEIKRFRRVETAGKIPTKAGEIDIVTSAWSFRDYAGRILVRLGYLRADYAVKPGLYAIGKPNATSPVFVSSNYKLSFDILRRDLEGLNGWLLVLDTKGVNVWCAAGKGTFGTKEIVARLIAARLSEIVTHTDLIVPQLGAPGVSAYKVMLYSGFKVLYGPVRSKDIKQFIVNGMEASPEMRKVSFNLADRLTVSLLELSMALEKIIPAAAGLIIVLGFSSSGFSLARGFEKALLPVTALMLAVFSGTVLSAALLPYLPGRAFSVKGGLLGLVTAFTAAFALNFPPISLITLSFVLFVSAIAAYLTLNFTGASTFTSLSGTKKEVRLSLPVIAAGMLVSLVIFFVKGY